MEVAVAELNDIEPGGLLAVTAGGYDLVLFRHGDGTVSALQDCCSHAEVALSGGEFADGVVQCPAHGARFDVRSGRHLCMPAVKGVRSFEARIRDGKIVVILPDE